MQLGQMIAKIRKEQGLTQEAFAEKFHVTRQTGFIFLLTYC